MEQEFVVEATLKIREVKVDDATSLHHYCFSHLPEKEVQEELASDVEKMGKGEIHRLVAVASGEHPIGNIKLELNKYGEPELAQIEDLAVHGPFRGLGVADRLIECITQVAQEKGVNTLQVQVPRSETRVIETYKEKFKFAEPLYVTLQKTVGEEEEETEAEEEEAEEVEEEEETSEEGTQQELLTDGG